MTLVGHDDAVNCVIQLTDGRLVSGSRETTLRIWDTISGNCLMTLQGHTYGVNSVTQLTDGRLVSSGEDNSFRIWNIMSLSQQKWIRRRLLVLLTETSKILIEPIKPTVIHQEQYFRRRRDLELLLRCSLNMSNIIINLNAFKITLKVLSIPEIVIRIAEYL
jgi:WD40 repeat protein